MQAFVFPRVRSKKKKCSKGYLRSCQTSVMKFLQRGLTIFRRLLFSTNDDYFPQNHRRLTGS